MPTADDRVVDPLLLVVSTTIVEASESVTVNYYGYSLDRSDVRGGIVHPRKPIGENKKVE